MDALLSQQSMGHARHRRYGAAVVEEPRSEKALPILLVEDDENDVYFLQLAWAAAGVRNALHVCENGQEAVEYLKRAGDKGEMPQAIITDIKMPRLDGFWASELVAKGWTVFQGSKNRAEFIRS
jgi:PleD family two-component response regulator